MKQLMLEEGRFVVVPMQFRHQVDTENEYVAPRQRTRSSVHFAERMEQIDFRVRTIVGKVRFQCLLVPP